MFLKRLFNHTDEAEIKIEAVAEGQPVQLNPSESASINTSLNPEKYTLTLFLDFEGVLHSFMTSKYYYVPNLCKVLDIFPHMDVVISSDYRRWSTAVDIQQIFGDYSHRITGITTLSHEYANRQAEIEQYVAEHGITNYIAIDDDGQNRLFNPSCDWLFKTDSIQALDDDTTVQFIEFIKARLNSSS